MGQPTSGIGTLQKVFTPCLRCNEDVHGFLVPDGRFVCPNCDPPAVFEHWDQIWALYEAELQPQDSADDAISEETTQTPCALFQCHLSTAVALMFLAGIFTFASLTYRGGDFGHTKNGFSFLWLSFLCWRGMEAWIERKTKQWIIILWTGLLASPALFLDLGECFYLLTHTIHYEPCG